MELGWTQVGWIGSSEMTLSWAFGNVQGDIRQGKNDNLFHVLVFRVYLAALLSINPVCSHSQTWGAGLVAWLGSERRLFEFGFGF